MGKGKVYTLSCRIDSEVNEIIESVMHENKLSKSEAVRYLAQHYKNSKGNNNPYYRNTIGWLTMNMESALNEIEVTGDVTVGRKVLEEFKCLIL